MRHSPLASILVPGLLAFALGGCSGKDRPTVAGTVTVDRTKPLAHARLEFIPAERGELGGDTVLADEDGKFEITAERGKSVLKPGKYYVLVTKWVDPKTGKLPAGTDDQDFEQLRSSGALKNLVPLRYSHPETPEHHIVVEIGPGQNDLKLDVKSR